MILIFSEKFRFLVMNWFTILYFNFFGSFLLIYFLIIISRFNSDILYFFKFIKDSKHCGGVVSDKVSSIFLGLFKNFRRSSGSLAKSNLVNYG